MLTFKTKRNTCVTFSLIHAFILKKTPILRIYLQPLNERLNMLKILISNLIFKIPARPFQWQFQLINKPVL